MMFEIKVYKYDASQEANGYRGEEFSKYALQGMDATEDITQVLDTGELTLAGLPIKDAFLPETKFIIDLLENGIVVQTLHYVVSRDVVKQPILSDNTYFDHHISFIEPSVVAQKRLVDNISATYKLKDVSLQVQPAYPLDQVTTLNVERPEKTLEYNFGSTNIAKDTYYSAYRRVFGKYFQLDGNAQMRSVDGTAHTHEYLNIDNFATETTNESGETITEYKAYWTLPKLQIFGGVLGSKNYAYMGDASIDYTITEYNGNDLSNATNQWSGTIISNSTLNNVNNNTAFTFCKDGWILESVEPHRNFGVSTQLLYTYYKKYTDTSASTPDYKTQTISISVGKRYVVSISLHAFADDLPSGLRSSQDFKFTGATPTFYVEYEELFNFAPPSSIIYIVLSQQNLTTAQTGGACSYYIYSIDSATIAYASATPYSALALLQKAIVNSGLYEKTDGIYMADVNAEKLPFYIDPNYINQLGATKIIESFYNQKNLWEIMVEVGNYIHAIPELKFGENDRFMITFNPLGRTDQPNKSGTNVSIFNSRSVEDYISATSSYITNMVQLGGYIEEYVAPKTTNETLLVSNDTASIITSKPITELMGIWVIRNSDGARADMTQFVFEENVYKTLSIAYNTTPNRGIALYYKLGTNAIIGGDYQLPQANTNIYSDYAIKKVIWSAFNGYTASPSQNETGGYWTNIKVNDYTFFIRYRTKDSVRQSHVRPDLRKYLLNSKWDRVPEHNQFNNQTDVVVDSIKFGNNMFGKLIRTGNNSYEIAEWGDNWEQAKHKGELYRINGELYYVAKVTHTIYTDCFTSKITYSKDYNELSNIIGIPSEPRFYEISEQSQIRREFEINDEVILTDNKKQLSYGSNYVTNFSHLADLVLSAGTGFARYAVSVFKGDKDAGLYDQTVGQKDLYTEVLTPINAYSSENTLTYKYDMADNYSAGDKVISTPRSAYTSLSAVKYTDIYGRATLFDFYIIGDIGDDNKPTVEQIKALPESFIETRDSTADNFIGNYNLYATNVKNFDTNFNGRGIGLLKDCRETISVNYNLRMITSSDTFVVSPFVFLPQKDNVKIVLLNEEVNKLSSGYINKATIVSPVDADGGQIAEGGLFDVPIDTQNETSWGKNVVSQFSINLAKIFEKVPNLYFAGAGKIKAIAVVCDVNLNPNPDTIATSIPYNTQFVIARNIPADWTREQALASWYFGAPNKDEVFKQKQ